MAARRPHAVVVPYPCSGNINPALQLAKLLHGHGVFITFVNTEHNHRRLLDTQTDVEEGAGGKSAAGALLGGGDGDGFRFETIPDGLTEAERHGGQADYGLSLSVATSQRCVAPMRELLSRLKDGSPSDGVPPVTCVVPTAFMSFSLDVAHELGIPTMVLWGCSAAALMGTMYIRELRESGHLPIKEASELETVIDWIPGMPPIQLGDISGFLRKTDEPDNFGLLFNETEANNCAKADALILNTFDDLEADVLAALQALYRRIYTVGPIGSLLHRRHYDDLDEEDDGSTAGAGAEAGGDLSLWKQDTGCLSWLDTQEPGSVVYVSFGSHAVLTPEEMAEFAWGLAASGRPFLWAVREKQVSGGGGTGGMADAEHLLLEPLAAAAASRGCLTTWCPQERVLRHRAVGCFVTHNGWNSTCESIAAGVPMVCWPGFADQYTNCKYACAVWGVGVQLDAEVRREQVAGHIQLVMGAEGRMMQSAAVAWRAKAAEAAGPGGSSHENLRRMVEALAVDSPPVDMQTLA